MKQEEELNNGKSKIMNLGEQKLVGMTSVMRNMLKGQWNDKYNVTGLIKPNVFLFVIILNIVIKMIEVF